MLNRGTDIEVFDDRIADRVGKQLKEYYLGDSYDYKPCCLQEIIYTDYTDGCVDGCTNCKFDTSVSMYACPTASAQYIR